DVLGVLRATRSVEYALAVHLDRLFLHMGGQVHGITPYPNCPSTFVRAPCRERFSVGAKVPPSRVSPLLVLTSLIKLNTEQSFSTYHEYAWSGLAGGFARTRPFPFKGL